MRVVRTPEGAVTIDPTGRMSGRGAYLCRSEACWDTARRKRAIEHALKVALPDDLVTALAAGPTTSNPDPDTDTTEGGAHGQE